VDQFTTSLSEELSFSHVEVANDMEEKTPRNNEINISPNFLDITEEQSFGDKAVMS